MKQFVLFLSILAFIQLARSVPAAADINSENAYANADQLIRSGDFLSKDGNYQLNLETQSLKPSIKKLLYDKYSMFDFPLLNGAANFLIPSLGSWLQGDWKGALITDIGFYSSTGVSLLFYWLSMRYALFMGDILVPNPVFGLLTLPFGFVAIGFYIVNLIFPFSYSANWNYYLKRGLDLQPVTSFHFDPYSYRTTRCNGEIRLNFLTFRF